MTSRQPLSTKDEINIDEGSALASLEDDFTQDDLYNRNGKIAPSQNIEEFNEELGEGFFDEDERIDEVQSQWDGSQSSQKENIDTQKLMVKEVKHGTSEATNRGFQDETTNNITSATVSNFNDGYWVCKDKEMSVSGDIQVDSGALPTVTNEKGESVLRMYWLDAYEDPFKHPGTVHLFGKVWVESAKAFASCCLTIQNVNRNIFLLKRDSRNRKIKNIDEQGDNDEVSIEDVYQEFNDKIAPRYQISEHKSKPRRMKYAFEYSDVPNEADYLQVMYSAKFQALPSNLTGETFSRIFGANQSSLEYLLLSCKIKGPGWLEIKAPVAVSAQMSWCKFEAKCCQPSQNISVMLPSKCKDANLPISPPLTIMALNIKTIINPKTHQNEIAVLCGLVHTAFYLDKPAPKTSFQSLFCGIARPSDEVWPFDFAKVLASHNQNSRNPRIEKQDTERALLGFLYAKIGKFDPDIIIGHDISGFDIEILLHRAVANKIPQWARIGRLKRSIPPWVSGGKKSLDRTATTGRLVCDLKISAKELIRCKSYDLATLSEKLLGKSAIQREIIDDQKMRKAYSSSNDLLKAADIGLSDVNDSLLCVYGLNALPLALQITQIAGNVMSRTLLGGRAERNDHLLLHAFHEKDYIVPDKQYGKNKSVKPGQGENDDQLNHDDDGGRKAGGATGRKKPAYAGGLVLEPKKGFYDKFILLMDFNSLYPSIIQEYNICFTTVSRENSSKTTPDKDDAHYIPELPPSNCEAGILPTEIKKLVESRREVKKLLKDPNLTPEKRMQFDIRQLGLKLTANSMYGCLGFSFSRFYAKPLAALVTSRGRDILLQTKELVERMNLEVIYGDTDSIMINSNSLDYNDVYKLGAKIKTEVNKMYKLLELEVDGVFRYMLLLKKKKYAAVTTEKSPTTGQLVDTTELKGLDVVRRDWCSLASNTGKEILNYILSALSSDERISKIHEKLENIAEYLNSGKVALTDLAIIKQLTKDPEDYPDKKSLAHVQVALRMNSKSGGKKLRAGDTVSYVICDDGSNLAATQRAYHIDEVRHDSKNMPNDASDSQDGDNHIKNHLKIDIHYYLAQQLHPVISRLCDPLDDTDSARIAQCLGLDPEQYRRNVYSNDARNDEIVSAKDEERFRSCEKFEMPPCKECGDGSGESKSTIVDSPVRNSGANAYFAFTKCPNLACNANPLDHMEIIQNRLTLKIREHIKKYYKGWVVCEDPGCSGRTRQLPLSFQRAFPICETCRKATMYMDYTDSQLYLQFLYYQNLFDTQRVLDRTSGLEKDALMKSLAKMSKQVESGEKYKNLKFTIDKNIQENNYSLVSLNKVFDGYFAIKAKERFGSEGIEPIGQPVTGK